MKRQIIDTIEKYDQLLYIVMCVQIQMRMVRNLGLAELIKHNYPTKEVYTVGEHDASLSFIAYTRNSSG